MMQTANFIFIGDATFKKSYIYQDIEMPTEIFKIISTEQYNFFNDYPGYKRTLGYKFVARSNTGTLYLEYSLGNSQRAIAIHRNGSISEMAIN